MVNETKKAKPGEKPPDEVRDVEMPELGGTKRMLEESCLSDDSVKEVETKKKKKLLPKLMLLKCKDLKEMAKKDFERDLGIALIFEDQTVELEDYFFTLNDNLILKPKTASDYDYLVNAKQLFKRDIIQIRMKRDDDLAIVVKGIGYDEFLEKEDQFEALGITAAEEIKSVKNSKFKLNLVKIYLENDDLKKKILKEGRLKMKLRSFKIEEYKKPIKITQCYRCQGFGHVKRQCTNKKSKCFICGEEHEGKCESKVRKCANCKEEHLSNSSKCKFIKDRIKLVQEKIEKKKSQTINGKDPLISYADACNPNESKKNENLFIKTITEITRKFEDTQKILKEEIKNEINSIKLEVRSIKETLEENINLTRKEIEMKFEERLNKEFEARQQWYIGTLKQEVFELFFDIYYLLNPNQKPDKNQLERIFSHLKNRFNINNKDSLVKKFDTLYNKK